MRRNGKKCRRLERVPHIMLSSWYMDECNLNRYSCNASQGSTDPKRQIQIKMSSSREEV
jgi:hypothetical protein